MDIRPIGDRSGALATFGIQVGPAAGNEVPIHQPVARIGRAPQNDIVIDDDSVSTTHALLEFDGGGWRLTDLGSTNGTSVEGVRLAPEVATPLPYGSTVRFGGVRLHFRAIEEADPAAAREEYTPPVPPRRIAEERTGFRIPVWLIVLLLLAVILALVIFGWMVEPMPAPTPAPAPPPATTGMLLPGVPPGGR